MDIGAYLLPVALVFGAPASPGTYEKGLFCESVELVERVAHFAERGMEAKETIADINGQLNRSACVYLSERQSRGRAVRFEKTIAVDGAYYSVYCVELLSFGTLKTEVGEIDWIYSVPVTMYTLRAALPAHQLSH